jgi:hypothetical protein
VGVFARNQHVRRMENFAYGLLKCLILVEVCKGKDQHSRKPMGRMERPQVLALDLRVVLDVIDKKKLVILSCSFYHSFFLFLK